jgi:hypothetical protein
MSNLRFNHPGYTLVAHLFRQFLVEEDIDTKQAEFISIRKFYRWARRRIESNPAVELPLFPDKAKLQEVYDITDDNFEFISELFESPFEACAHLYTWWPLICLAARGPSKHNVQAISLAVSIRFEDGVTLHFPMPLGQQTEPYSDGLVLTLWRGQLAMVAHMMRSRSLDELHDIATAQGLTTASMEVEIQDDIESDIGLCKEDLDYDDDEDEEESD